MKITETELNMPAEKLLEKHKIEHGSAPAYNSEVIGIINTLTRMIREKNDEISFFESKMDEYGQKEYNNLL